MITKLIFGAYLAVLVNAAKNDGNPETYYDVICDALSDEYYDQLISTLKKDDWFDHLFKGQSVFKDHQPWFTRLRNLFIEADEAKDGSEQPKDG